MTTPDPWVPLATVSPIATVPGGLLHTLTAKLARSQAAMYEADRYYEGDQPLRFLAPEVAAQIGGRLAPVVINWPRTIVDSVQRRCYAEGFRLGKGGEADDELWRIWQANDLDEWSQLAQADALVHGRSFLLVWGNEEDPETPRITVESAHQMAVQYAPGNRAVSAAVKRWTEGEREHSTLYLPDRVLRYVAGPQSEDWRLVETVPNPLGAVPVVPVVNRPRLLNLDGESELTDVIPLADAVNKLATDMLVTSEFHATKRRWATGIQIPTGPDRERLQAEVARYWDEATKGKTWLAGQGVNFGQFDEASLENFVNGIRLLTAQIAAIAGLPPHYLGINTDNPASADAIRSAESTLVERAKEKHRAWGGSYERAMRLAVAVRDGVPAAQASASLQGMETIWRDPETPTVAQSADAAVKLYQAGIIDAAQAMEDVGLSPVQRKAIEDRRAEAEAAAATADVRARMALARELVANDGLTLNAAMAAAGLLQAAATNSTETPTPPQ